MVLYFFHINLEASREYGLEADYMMFMETIILSGG